MPLIYQSSYTKRPLLLFNSYLETLIPYFSARGKGVAYERERLELEDGDFLDLDWVRNQGDKLLVVTHGFEGNTQDVFMEQSAAYFSAHGYDVLLWNLRSCSAELNRLPRFYHHGDIEDLDAVIRHGKQSKSYDEISLVGFSLGGAILINYLGSTLPKEKVKCAVAVSVPLDINETSHTIGSGWNKFILERNFLNKIKKKVLKKAKQFPELISEEKVRSISSLQQMHEEVVLLLNGYSSNEAYHTQWSCLQSLHQVDLPLLIINAKNDPLLSSGDFPYTFCEKSPNVHLETPKFGGHVGFSKKLKGEPWYLQRIHAFTNNLS